MSGESLYLCDFDRSSEFADQKRFFSVQTLKKRTIATGSFRYANPICVVEICVLDRKSSTIKMFKNYNMSIEKKIFTQKNLL